ncbi:MAG: UDP-3-O-acyl-N-acetylglucosamine deacetylase [Rhodospirillales bacterium]
MNAVTSRFSQVPVTESAEPAPVYQRTLKQAINCTGIGLHSGNKVSMKLRPAEAGSGIRFRRTDIKGGGAVLAARYDAVVDTRMCTVIGNADGVTLATIEHLMAALAGAGIDNLDIEINGAEVPVMDGSSAPFVFLVECAGVVEQKAARKAVKVLKPVIFQEGNCRAALMPGFGQTLSMDIDFDSQAIGRQRFDMALTDGAFKKEICRARTFGFLHEVEQLRAAGLARGGSLDNAVVISGDKVMNEDGLRYGDEFVRHKMLDAIGDLYLAGGPILGEFQGYRSGHRVHNLLLRELFADPANFAVVDMTRDQLVVAEPVSGLALRASA